MNIKFTLKKKQLLNFSCSLTLKAQCSVCSRLMTDSHCTDGLGVRYILPMFSPCQQLLDDAGNLVQTLPKLVPYPPYCGHYGGKRHGIPPGTRVCKFPGK